MIFSTQFGGGSTLGTILQGYGLSEPQYTACDGGARLRTNYPRLSTLFPIGILTGTVRTLPVNPPNFALAASPNYFVASTNSSAVTTAIQYSADGSTWSQTSVVTPSVIVTCLLYAGNRWIAGCGASAQPIVTTGDNPNSTWVTTTSGPNIVLPRSGMAYSPVNTRVVAFAAGNSTTVYTLDAGSTTWVARTTPAQDRAGICFSGARFITLAINAATISTSNDGATGWADEVLPEPTSATQGAIASNGAGVVVISGVASGLLVSFDHGATFNKASIPGVPASDTWKVQYSGDRFFVPTALGVAMSLDGKAWFLETQLVQARVVDSMFAKKGAAIVQVRASATAYSFSESATSFRVPLVQQFTPALTGNPIPLANFFIKAL